MTENSSDEWTAILLFLALVVAPLLSVALLLNLCYKIEISDEGVRIFRFGRGTVVLPFEEYFVGYYNHSSRFSWLDLGENINAQRYLDTVRFDGCNKIYNCFSFSPKTMQSMCAHLQSVENNTVDYFQYLKKSPISFIDGKYEMPVEGIHLHFPQNKCQSVVSQQFSKQSIVLGFFAISFYAIFFVYYFYIEAGLPMGVAQYFPWVLVPGILTICAVLALGVFYFRQSASIPEEIRFNRDVMVIDDQIFYKNEITSISATASIVLQKPFRFGRISRKMTITTLRGKYKYFLGHINTKKGRFFFDDYSILIDSIAAFMPQEKETEDLSED